MRMLRPSIKITWVRWSGESVFIGRYQRVSTMVVRLPDTFRNTMPVGIVNNGLNLQ